MLKQINFINFPAIIFLLVTSFTFIYAQSPETREQKNIRIDSYNRAVEDPTNKINSLRKPLNEVMPNNRNFLPNQTFRKKLLENLTKIDLKLTTVIDGNTLKTDQTNFLRTVRISGIDAPENGQPGYDEAKEFLKEKLSNKSVTFYYSFGWSYDLDNVYLVRIEADGKDIGYEMLSKGLVWYDKAYDYFMCKDDVKSYNNAVKQAQKSKVGIWKDKKPETPWKFRDLQRKKRKNSQ